MGKYHPVDNGLYRNLKSNYMALTRADMEGNFGCWCYFDQDLFCQEREGCDNCTVKKR